VVLEVVEVGGGAGGWVGWGAWVRGGGERMRGYSRGRAISCLAPDVKLIEVLPYFAKEFSFCKSDAEWVEP
jgi:hypothetical protein